MRSPKNMKPFDCLIPFYNEEAHRLQSVISSLLSIPFIGKIICIDDGSKNDTYKEIQTMFRNTKKVQVLRYVHNAGKSEALRKGLASVHADTVLTLDADMSNIHPSEIISAYQELCKRKYKLLILQLIYEPHQARYFRGDVVLSGQRFIRTALLREVYRTMHPHGYAVEMATNLYVMDHGKPYGVMPFSAHNILPLDKLGIGKGIQKEIRQLHDMFSNVGIAGFFKTYVKFGKERRYILP